MTLIRRILWPSSSEHPGVRKLCAMWSLQAETTADVFVYLMCAWQSKLGRQIVREYGSWRHDVVVPWRMVRQQLTRRSPLGWHDNLRLLRYWVPEAVRGLWEQAYWRVRVRWLRGWERGFVWYDPGVMP